MSLEPETNENTPTPSVSLGLQLKSAREARGLTHKDIASQLRLSEPMIKSLEDNASPHTLPTAFIRGYLRAYARLMDLKEVDIKAGLEPYQPSTLINIPQYEIDLSLENTVTKHRYLIKFISVILLITVISLVLVSQFTHRSTRLKTTLLSFKNLSVIRSNS